MILEGCRRHGFEPRVIARSSQIDFIVELVSAGLGVAFLPRMIAAQQARPTIHQARLQEPHTQWQLAMMWRRGIPVARGAGVAAASCRASSVMSPGLSVKMMP